MKNNILFELICVIQVLTCSLSTHVLSIFGDHQDVYVASRTTVCMLASSNVGKVIYELLVDKDLENEVRDI